MGKVVDLFSTSHCERETVVEWSHLKLHQRFLAWCYALSTCLFNQKSHCCRLVQCSKLALVRFWSDVAENAVSLDENLPNIRDQTASVPESIAFFDPPTHYLVVLLVLIHSSQVAGAKHLRFLFDSEVLMRDNPLLLYQSQLLHDLFFSIVNESSSPGAVNSYNCIYLVAQFGSNQIVGVGFPNGEDAANRKICIDDWTAI